MNTFSRWTDRISDCTLPCAPTPPSDPPTDADEHYGPDEFWTCPKHGSHTGRRRYLTWEQGGVRYGWWSWAVGPTEERFDG